MKNLILGDQKKSFLRQKWEKVLKKIIIQRIPEKYLTNDFYRRTNNFIKHKKEINLEINKNGKEYSIWKEGIPKNIINQYVPITKIYLDYGNHSLQKFQIDSCLSNAKEFFHLTEYKLPKSIYPTRWILLQIDTRDKKILLKSPNIISKTIYIGKEIGMYLILAITTHKKKKKSYFVKTMMGRPKEWNGEDEINYRKH